MKKLFLGLAFMLVSYFSFGQNGLERIRVEKYHVATQADHDLSVSLDGADGVTPLEVGAVTYRIYVDMLPGYRMQFAYWNENHSLEIISANEIYNRSGSSYKPNYTRNSLLSSTVINNYDSWVSMGSATSVNTTQANWVVRKDLDSDGTVDGYYFTGGTGYPALGPIAPDVATAQASELQNLLGDGSANGTQFIKGGDGQFLLAGSWYNIGTASSSPSVYPTGTNNEVCIAQITTLGRFQFKLNIQVVRNSDNVSEYYVHSNPGLTSTGVAERTLSSLTYDSQNEPVAPTVTLSASPASGRLNSVIALTATPADANGINTIDSVVFLNGTTRLGRVTSSPYTLNYTLTANASFTAVVYDNTLLSGTSPVVPVNIVANTAPVISNFTVSPGTVKVGRTINFSATITDDFGNLQNASFHYGGTNIPLVVVPGLSNVYSGSN
jgi:hypothetical protein